MADPILPTGENPGFQHTFKEQRYPGLRNLSVRSNYRHIEYPHDSDPRSKMAIQNHAVQKEYFFNSSGKPLVSRIDNLLEVPANYVAVDIQADGPMSRYMFSYMGTYGNRVEQPSLFAYFDPDPETYELDLLQESWMSLTFRDRSYRESMWAEMGFYFLPSGSPVREEIISPKIILATGDGQGTAFAFKANGVKVGISISNTFLDTEAGSDNLGFNLTQVKTDSPDEAKWAIKNKDGNDEFEVTLEDKGEVFIITQTHLPTGIRRMLTGPTEFQRYEELDKIMHTQATEEGGKMGAPWVGLDKKIKIYSGISYPPELLRGTSFSSK